MRVNHEESVTVNEQDVAPHAVPQSAPHQPTPQAGQLLGAVKALFHTPDRKAYASVEVNGHIENYAVEGPEFRDWLGRNYYRQNGKSAPDGQIDGFIATARAQAIFDGPSQEVFVRVAPHDGNIYIDLGDAAWQAVRVSVDGYEVVSNPPVRFRRSKGMLPLPLPEEGNINELRRFVNVADDDQFVLMAAWAVAALRPHGPYPVLEITGEQGTAKSTTTRSLVSVIDPTTTPTRAAPADDRDLAVAANNRWVQSFDNMSYIKPELSDSLCRIATGGGFGKRQNYTDDGEVLFSFQRPVILNGIADLATRSDLMERTIIIRPPVISTARRRDERSLEAEFQNARPRIFGALLAGVAGALRNERLVQLDELPRMADFMRWATAAEEALGWARGTVAAAYSRNRAEGIMRVVDGSDAAKWLLDNIQEQWQGTAAQLLDQLHADWEVGRRRKLPQSPAMLGRHLREIAPNLRAAGLELEFDSREGAQGKRMIYMRRKAVSGVSAGSTEEAA